MRIIRRLWRKGFQTVDKYTHTSSKATRRIEIRLTWLFPRLRVFLSVWLNANKPTHTSSKAARRIEIRNTEYMKKSPQLTAGIECFTENYLTFILIFIEEEPSFAVITAEPFFLAVTLPFEETEATEDLELDHFTEELDLALKIAPS